MSINSNDLKNMTPQQLQQMQTQEFTSMLQAPNMFGTDKLLINVNGQNSKIKTNKNSIIKYTLEKPVKLEIGDKITLLDSFVEERGLSIDTISIDTDIVEQMRFMYYIQGDCRNNLNTPITGDTQNTGQAPDQEFAHFPSFFADCYNGDLPYISKEQPFIKDPNQDPGVPDDNRLQGWPNIARSLINMPGNTSCMFPQTNFLDQCNIGQPGTGGKGRELGTTKNINNGATGQYYYMMEWFSPAVPGEAPMGFPTTAITRNNIVDGNKFFFRPLYGQAEIVIPSGNYSVTALSKLINDQLTGSITAGRNPMKTSALTKKLFVDTDSLGATQTVPFFDGIASKSYRDVVAPELDNPDSLIIGADTYQGWQRRRGDILTKCYFNNKFVASIMSVNNLRGPTFDLYSPGGIDPTTRDGIPWQTQWVNGENFGYGTGLTENPLAGNNSQLMNFCRTNDRLLWNKSSPNEIQLKSFQCNFFMHLDGLKGLFEGGTYSGTTGDFIGQTGKNKSAYYYQNDNDPNFVFDITNYNWYKMPNLPALLKLTIGDKGLYFFNESINNPAPDKGVNTEQYPPSEYPKWIYPNDPYNNPGTINGNGNPFPNAPLYSGQRGNIEDFKFSYMFPVWGSNRADLRECFGWDKDWQTSQGMIQQFAGTASFNLSYDTAEANRFSLSNLHEPYKLPSVTPDGKNPTNLGGQQGTFFPSTMKYVGQVQEADITSGNVSYTPAQYVGVYPIDSAGGIAVNNFAFNSVKNTAFYKEQVAKINLHNTANINQQFYREKLIYDLFTKPYEEFFTDEAEARATWDTTIWSRLGFTYEQLGDVSSNLEKIYSFTAQTNERGDGPGYYPTNHEPNFITQKGVITHNAYNNTFIPSSNGLGIGGVNYSTAATTISQSYGLRGYHQIIDANVFPTGLKQGDEGVIQNNITLLCDSQPINADKFPSLNNGNNYFLIESDIVKQNAKDANSCDTTIVGVMSKENATNDTIFSINPITFTVTEPKLLATIEVRIKNPDGNLASDDIVGKNNGFIFQIEKAIQPAIIVPQSF